MCVCVALPLSEKELTKHPKSRPQLLAESHGSEYVCVDPQAHHKERMEMVVMGMIIALLFTLWLAKASPGTASAYF